MRVLITGGLGYIGSAVAGRLLERGDFVLAVDIPRLVSAPPTPHENLTVHYADITDPSALVPLVRGVDVVVHAAGIHHPDEVVRQPNRHVEVNVNGTYNVLDAALNAGVPRFVHLSSAKVYGRSVEASSEADFSRPADEYALGKYAAETFCSHFASTTPLEVCVVRPFSVYGPGMDLRTGYCGMLLDALVSGTHAVLPGRPDFARDFVHLDTLTDVIVAAVTSEDEPPALLNVGSGVANSLAQLADIFNDQVCRDLKVIYIEPRPGTLERSLADTSLMKHFACPNIPTLRTGIQGMLAELQVRG